MASTNQHNRTSRHQATNATTTIEDDEALARALQEEYEAESRRQNLARQVAAARARVQTGSAPTAAPTTATQAAPKSRSASASRRMQAPAPVSTSHQSRRSQSAERSHNSQRPAEKKVSVSSRRYAQEVAKRTPERTRSHSSGNKNRSAPSATVVRGRPVAPAVANTSDSFTRMANISNPRMATSSEETFTRMANISNPRINASSTSRAASNPRSRQEAQDEALARELEAEFRRSRQQQEALIQQQQAQRAQRSFRQQGTSSRDNADYEQRSAPQRMKSFNTPATSRSNSLTDDPILDTVRKLEDEELARRVEQEFDDEDFARKLTLQEQQRAAAAEAARQRQLARTAPASGAAGCSIRRFCCYLIPMGVIAASAAAILYYFVYQNKSLPGWIPDPKQFANEDPFVGQSPNETSRWPNQGRGLELEILNSLTTEWTNYFYTAVQQWDDGNPDALTLTTSQIDADSTCKTIAKKLKVCNGNYGDTQWRGINKLLLEDGYIYASAARMNEYYFNTDLSDKDQRQYTMCHEMGHGFGLPHTDENFDNKDLGNCMDYTNRPQNNKQPSVMNYDFLKDLYGVVPGGNDTAGASNQGASSASDSVNPNGATTTTGVNGATTTGDATSVPQDASGQATSETSPPQQQKPPNQKNDKNNNGPGARDRRLNGPRAGPRGQTRRSNNRRTSNTGTIRKSTPRLPLNEQEPNQDSAFRHAELPSHIAKSVDDVDEQIRLGLISSRHGWNLLHRTVHGEAHEKVLGDGFTVQIHLLLA